MKLVDNLKGIESYYLIISGNGTFPESVIFKSLCKKYNGYDKAIFSIYTPLKKQTGLAAFNAIPLISKKFLINSIIFIVDGEHIKENARIEIKEHLETIGVSINEFNPLEGAFLIKCKSGPCNITLYCIILGPEVFIEESFINKIKSNDSIWETFNKFHQNNQEVQLKDIPSLEELLNEIFLTSDNLEIKA